MKILFSLLVAYLMTSGGGCEQAEFIDNSRIVVEGQVLDSLEKPIPNKIIFYSNGIQSSQISTKNDGSFLFSSPKTTSSSTLETGNQIVSFQSLNDSLRIVYPNRLIINKTATYVNVKLITK